MKLNTAPDNEVELGGVTATSEFRIRNSAKAFGILSSGLYANKIRAIIREISCNAVDSHVAAGKADVPFEVHLPTQMAPYFWVRDFGIGLDHDAVCNIYTTYFESTKTDSNDFIGALGLGSKSPFSYTDNFTVTAIKNGIKRVYSAFINQAGVPSVALMGEAETTEETGVEVKFSVNDKYDFQKFKLEAEYTYKYFKIQPTVLGQKIAVEPIVYTMRNIIPGVHQRSVDRYYGEPNNAIMGNIVYPIDIPRKESEEDRWGRHRPTDPMGQMSMAGLDIHFAIGEIDFQASREGLQYTAATIAAIHAKYNQILKILAVKFAEDVSKEPTEWDKAKLIKKLSTGTIWSNVAKVYLSTNPCPLLDVATVYHGYEPGYKTLLLDLNQIKDKYNLNLAIHHVNRHRYGRGAVSVVHPSNVSTQLKDAAGKWITKPMHELYIQSRMPSFVPHFSQKKFPIGNMKYHYVHNKTDGEDTQIIVITPADATKPVLYDEMMKDVFFSPPSRMIVESDKLTPAPKVAKAVSDRKISMLRISDYRSKGILAWQPVEFDAATNDPNQTYYYVPMKGFDCFLPDGTKIENIKDSFESFNKVFHNTEMKAIYGVRKGDIDAVQNLPNWKLAATFMTERFAKLTEKDFYKVAINELDRRGAQTYTTSGILKLVTNENSEFKLFSKMLSNLTASSMAEFKELCTYFAPTVDIAALEEKAMTKAKEVAARYPMLNLLNHVSWDDYHTVADYINLIDNKESN